MWIDTIILRSMTDNSILLSNRTAVSQDVLYNMKPSMVRGRSYRCAIQSSNKSTFAPGDSATHYIPARRNCFLDQSQTYLRMTIKNTSTTGNLNIDGSAACLINRMDVFHGSNLLESLQGYGDLFSHLLDFGASQSDRVGLEAMYGTTSDRSGKVIPAAGSITFCIPILSGIVGVNSEKLLPLSLADDLRLETTIESAIRGVVGTAADVLLWSITSFQIMATIVELNDEGMSIINSITPFSENIFMHGSSYRHYSGILANGSVSQQSLLIPARFASLKDLIVLPHSATDAVAANYSQSSRVNPNFSQYQFRIGSLLCPQSPVMLTGGYAEAFSEVVKSFHGLGMVGASPSIGSVIYNAAYTVDATSGVKVASTGANSYTNGFSIAIELETIANRSDVILSGINSLNSTIFFEANIANAIGAQFLLDFYAHYDSIFILEPTGLLSVRF
jgi:hypothetical protein